MRFFTHYWRSDTWKNYRGSVISYSAGGGLKKRGLSPGDRIYVVTNLRGRIRVGGYLDIARIVDRPEARRLMGREVWDAEEFAIASAAVPFREDLVLAPEIVRKLRFEPDSRPLVLKRGRVDQQTLRGLRELAPASAVLLDQALGIGRRVAPHIRESDKAFGYVALRNALHSAWREGTETQRKFLLAHYGLPGQTGSSNEIARAAGYSDYHASNAHYGPLARRVAQKLGYRPNQWLTTLTTTLEHNERGHWRLRLDDDVVRAIQELDLGGVPAVVATPGIPDGITRDDILDAIERFNAGAPHEFADSTKYDLLHRGRRYPPKAIVGLAAERLVGRVLGPADFSGGISSKCFRVLESAGFDVIPKDTVPFAELADEVAEEELNQRTDIGPTERETLINARRGQGVFRQNVEQIEQSCRVTGLFDRRHLRASHIKPWRVASDQEKLDGNNGLLLSPHIDHLFDQGHLSFNDEGVLLISKYLNPAVLELWNLKGAINVGKFNERQREYLAYHREHVFERERPVTRKG